MESNERDRLMKEIQLCTFSLVEANLYLDTHPCDQEALRFYEKTESVCRSFESNTNKNMEKLQSMMTVSFTGPGSMSHGRGRWGYDVCGNMKRNCSVRLKSNILTPHRLKSL